MNKWKAHSLETICTLITDGAHNSPTSVDGGYPMASVKDMTPYGLTLHTCRHISESDYFALVKQGCQPEANDILIAKDGATAIDTVCIVKEKENVVLLSSVAILRPNAEVVNPFYLKHYLSCESVKAYIKGTFVTGAAIPRVVLKDFKQLKVELPELKLQNKIISMLNDYDNLIENNNRRIAILEEMAQKLYREWFVHFRFPGHGNVQMVESEMGLIPEGWTVQSPKEVAAHYIGGGWGKESCSDALKPAFVIRGTDIPNARQNDIENCPLRYHTKSNLKDRCLSNGDIAIEVSGGSKGQPVGRPLLITSELLESFNGQQVICASFCKLYRCNSTLINPYYVYLWLLEIYKNGEIEKYQSQSTGIINFKFEYFLDSPIILVPQIDVQNAFNKQVQMVFKQINNLGKKNTNLRKSRDLLLPRLISGDIDVSELDIPIKEG